MRSALVWFVVGFALREIVHAAAALWLAAQARREGLGAVSDGWRTERLQVRELD